MGVDINKISRFGILLVVIVYYTPSLVFHPQWEQEINGLQSEIAALNTELSALVQEVRERSVIREKLESYKKEIARLEERTRQVQELLDKSSNPKRALEVVARSTPEKMWFDDIIIKNDSSIEIKGGAENFVVIREFLASANNSPFFGRSLILSSSTTQEEEIAGVKLRVERYQIDGKISVFDPL